MGQLTNFIKEIRAFKANLDKSLKKGETYMIDSDDVKAWLKYKGMENIGGINHYIFWDGERTIKRWVFGKKEFINLMMNGKITKVPNLWR